MIDMALYSKEVIDKDGKQYHIKCAKGDVGRYVLLPGDPFRTDIIAERLDDPRLVAHNREHKTWTGTLDGVAVSVCSTGMGGPSAAIALEELVHCGADTFIRVGTAGRLCDKAQDEAINGVIVTASVRDEGTGLHYIPIEYPAVASRLVVEALAKAAAEKGLNYMEGIAQSKDSFYGQHDPDSMPGAARLKDRWEAWKRAGVLCSEMETAAIFVVSSIRGVRAGAIMSFVRAGSTGAGAAAAASGRDNMADTIDTAVLALRKIIADER
jgi:uridine phosphorylase